ncbi:MAG: coproporphyrinogen III oxidase [Candidatus Fluviicola riflensis]|nr:MAG: coproporphyrinogen III oxidase [Candidatus Fluviicola riflensis]OGS76042.1 MAG: coproporphyrinogen III oxidase [Candidatus Fluviicola riflensis]OGS81942.1 MAG: coproporphyrinogen III oxidase [Fluviicola sp. RIFCSPHIGHO2_01_FULL_43_53]OGS83380.1 MAG: coproporphyrinogen III oxidase [Fluviicola sp. RIFCSPHIGHO2_12_FULL_43_24]
MNKEAIAEQMRELQLFICAGLEQVDGSAIFSEDAWNRAEGGGGFTRTIKNGNVLEKGGVAFSAVHGPVSEIMRKQLQLDGDSFFATGVSIVLHPHNPHVPIIHMNVRYFELNTGVYWFGGGIDLTPHYIVPAQAQLFHQRLKDICDQFDPEFYNKFKPWADEYFYIPHRNETRGIGGVFFDHLNNHSSLSKEQLFAFCLELGRNFPAIYGEQVALGKDKQATEQQIQWRNLRRGRYVEFNLVNDRGTKFGLLSGGRTESILMSLPAVANWEYGFIPEPGSAEEATLKLLSGPQNWLSEN